MAVDLTPRIGKPVVTSTTGEVVRAYVPQPLPPQPPLDLGRLIDLIERANQSLGRLDGIATILPSPSLFIYMYLRKEALLSSQIEGTQSSLSDLLMFENDDAPIALLDDVREVSNYVAAMHHGLKRLADGFPMSLRLIRELHQELMLKGRGSTKLPGEFRHSQNWIGGTRPGNARFVPPPPGQALETCLSEFERFLHYPTYSPLIRSALMHVQFETIHPFLDGNGRLGRLLITLLLCDEKVLAEPILYLSLYFKTHRTRYYELLQIVRDQGDWEAWIEFFLHGVIETSKQGVATAKQLQTLFRDDAAKITELGRPAASALRVHIELQRTPILPVLELAKRLQLSQPTIQKSIEHLLNLDIVTEITGKRWRRLYRYQRYLDILDQGTEPIPR